MRAWVLVLLGGCDLVFELKGPTADTPADSSMSLPPACPMDQRLLACWDFENNAQDPIGGNDLFETNADYKPGIDGFALESTMGTRLDLSEPNLNTLTLTVDAWIRTDMPSRGQLVIDHNARWAMAINPNGGLECYDASGSSAISTVPVPVGSWVHVACVHDGTSLVAYISGAMLGDLTPAAGIPSVPTDLCVANDGPKTDPPSPFIGGIDRLRVWNAPLSRAELLEAAGQ